MFIRKTIGRKAYRYICTILDTAEPLRELRKFILQLICIYKIKMLYERSDVEINLLMKIVSYNILSLLTLLIIEDIRGVIKNICWIARNYIEEKKGVEVSEY